MLLGSRPCPDGDAGLSCACDASPPWGVLSSGWDQCCGSTADPAMRASGTAWSDGCRSIDVFNQQKQNLTINMAGYDKQIDR